MHDDQARYMGQAEFERISGKDVDAALVEPTVLGVYRFADKRGEPAPVATARSNAWDGSF